LPQTSANFCLRTCIKIEIKGLCHWEDTFIYWELGDPWNLESCISCKHCIPRFWCLSLPLWLLGGELAPTLLLCCWAFRKCVITFKEKNQMLYSLPTNFAKIKLEALIKD
jgi:hypothetical protein